MAKMLHLPSWPRQAWRHHHFSEKAEALAGRSRSARWASQAFLGAVAALSRCRQRLSAETGCVAETARWKLPIYIIKWPKKVPHEASRNRSWRRRLAARRKPLPCCAGMARRPAENRLILQALLWPVVGMAPSTCIGIIIIVYRA